MIHHRNYIPVLIIPLPVDVNNDGHSSRLRDERIDLFSKEFVERRHGKYFYSCIAGPPRVPEMWSVSGITNITDTPWRLRVRCRERRRFHIRIFSPRRRASGFRAERTRRTARRTFNFGI